MKHLLDLASQTTTDIEDILERADGFKANRRRLTDGPLADQVWAMIFSKSSTRTRVSFEVGIRELGGQVMFLSASEIQLGRGEPIEDTARVLGRMVHGAVIRTYEQSEVVDFSRHARIPTINALTDAEHPCQILADLQTIRERLGRLEGVKIVFVGDGDCNVSRSWIHAAAKLGLELRIAAPREFQPPSELAAAAGGAIHVTDDVAAAVDGVDAIYTDVWVSMGKEAESEARLASLAPFQVNAALLRRAKPDAMVMHCLPAYRGKEITHEVLESHADTIFAQAENRLHAQKGVLAWITSGRESRPA